MADSQDSLTQHAAAAQATLAQSQNLAEALRNTLNSNQSKSQASLDSLMAFAKIQEKIAAQNKELIRTADQLAKLAEKRAALEKKISENSGDTPKKAAELENLRKTYQKYNEEIDTTRLSLNRMNIELKSTEKAVKDLTASPLDKFLESGKTKLLGFLFGLERITSGLNAVTKSARDFTDISIEAGDFKGLQSFIGTAGWAVTYAKELQGAQTSTALLGISTEETAASFKQFSKIVSFKKQSGEIQELTVVSARLSQVLGVSLGETTEFIIQGQQKFGRTAGQSVKALKDLYDSTKKVNDITGDSTIRQRDVAKALFDVSNASEGLTQNQELLGSMITKNLVGLQEQGDTYAQALKGASTYIKALTSNAPDWAKIMAGNDLVKQVKIATTAGGKLTGDMVASLEKERPGLAKSIQGILDDEQNKKISPYVANRLMQQTLEGTSMGLNSMGKQLEGVISKMGGNANIAIQQMYGVDFKGAQQLIDQATKEKKIREDMTKIKSGNVKDLVAGGMDKGFLEKLRHEDDSTIQSALEKHETEVAAQGIAKQKQDRVTDTQAAMNKAQAKLQSATTPQERAFYQDQFDSSKKAYEEASKPGELSSADKKTIGDTNKELGADMAGANEAGNGVNAIMTFLNGPLTKIATGALLAGPMLANQLASLLELRGIRLALGGKSALDKVTDMFKKKGGGATEEQLELGLPKAAGGIGKLLAGQGYGGAGSVAGLFGSGAAGAATVIGGVAIAALVGVGAGMLINKLFGDKIANGIWSILGTSDADALAKGDAQGKAGYENSQAHRDFLARQKQGLVPGISLPPGSQNGPAVAPAIAGPGAPGQPGDQQAQVIDGQLVQGAQGASMKLQINVPMGAAHAYNTNLAQQYGGTPVSR